MDGILYQRPPTGILGEPEQPLGALYSNPLMARQVANQRASNPRPNVTDIFGYGPDWQSYLANFNKNLAENYPTDSPEAINRTVLRMAQNIGPLATVFHGSPHLFDKFDMSKIGTGEGAQAYGHGLYLAQSPTVAKTYQGKVSAMQGGKPIVDGRPINWDNPAETAAFELARHNGDREAAASFYESTFKKSTVPSLLRSGVDLPKVEFPGNLYKVDLPDEAIGKMLDWDKPLSQQPETVRNLVNSVQRIPNDEWASVVKAAENGADNKWGLSVSALSAIRRGDVKTGADLVNVVGNGPAASAALRAHGITGIKYLDQGSRSGGKGTSNYVVFDDQIPKIIGRE
jgi:hypothetical protein